MFFDMEINELSHPDSIWVYKGSRRGEKVSIWIPYLHEIKKEKAKNTYLVSYRGGRVLHGFIQGGLHYGLWSCWKSAGVFFGRSWK